MRDTKKLLTEVFIEKYCLEWKIEKTNYIFLVQYKIVYKYCHKTYEMSQMLLVLKDNWANLRQ